MKNLIALPDDPTYLDRYLSIRQKKHKATRTTLTDAHELIVQRYKIHAEALTNGSLANIQRSENAIQLSVPLRACYDKATQPLKQLKQAILDAQPERLLKYCPMCGTTLPSTFDHYMPGVKFPEFAVHPLNLVPCCSICNSTKDDDWLSAAGNRQYLHAYTDHIPDLPFVKVTLHEDPALTGVGATFSLERPENIADDKWHLIDSHFCRLKLIQRYDERGNDEVAEILANCCQFLSAGGQNVRKFLKGCAKERRAIYGRNHWIVVLMDAIAQHNNFKVWLKRMKSKSR